MNAPIKIRSYTILTNLTCNLRCTYCYENKCGKVNNLEDIQDYIKGLYKQDFENNKENQEEMQIYLDIIGGESLLHPELIDGACQTALEMDEKYNIKKPFILNMTTNAVLLLEPEVQETLLKWVKHLHLGISIDGTKENHDKCRIDAEGNGSYDRAVKGYRWAQTILCPHKIGVKATFCHDTIKGYADGVINLIDLGFRTIGANVIFEETWDDEDAMTIASQMVKIIDYLFDNGLQDKVHIFQINNAEMDMRNYIAESGPKDRNHCGACTHMRCLGFNKEIYGCQRFATMKTPIPIGHMENEDIVITNDAFCQEIAEQYNQWPDECKKCPYVQQCPSCSAIPYEQDGPKAYFARKPQCGFTKAVVLARMYFKKRLLETETEQSK